MLILFLEIKYLRNYQSSSKEKEKKCYRKDRNKDKGKVIQQQISYFPVRAEATAKIYKSVDLKIIFNY